MAASPAARPRSFWLALGLVLYAALAVARLAPRSPSGLAVLVIGPLALAIGYRLASPPSFGADFIDPAARSAGRAVAAGAAIALTSLLGQTTSGMSAARALGLGLCATGAVIALGRIAPLGGAATRWPPNRDAPFAVGLMWLAAFVLTAARALAPAAIGALTVDYALVAASLGSIGVIAISAVRVYAARRFELGVAERAAAALWLGIVALAIGALATLMEVADAEDIAPLCALAAAIAAAGCAISQQAVLCARVLRTAAAATMLATPLMCVAVLAAFKTPTRAGQILFAATGAAVGLGMLVRPLAGLLAPERGKWLRVLQHACERAKAPEPRQAVAGSLCALRDGLGPNEGRAALYRFGSRDRLVVDRADYLHAEAVQAPLALADRLGQEPERLASTEAFRFRQVREADLRALVTWLDDAAAGAAALVQDGDVSVGLLLIPAAGRRSPLSYEEVLALRLLADLVGVAAGADAALERSRARELTAERGLAQAERALRGSEVELDRARRRERAAIAARAAEARVGAYGPASQTALVEAQRLAHAGQSLAILARPGQDAVAWAALVHRTGARANEAFVVVDGAAETSLEGWRGDDSPLALAKGGTLVIVDAQLLAADAQRFVGSAAESDATVVAILPAACADRAALDAHLAARLGDRVLDLPPLSARAEDLQALALSLLARIGERVRGEPLGIAPDALQVLGEQPWPGNESELEAVLMRAVAASKGARVERADVNQALGLLDPGPAEPEKRKSRGPRASKRPPPG